MSKLAICWAILMFACAAPIKETYEELPLPSERYDREIELSARVNLKAGDRFLALGDWQKASEQFLSALALRKRIFGNENLYTDGVYLKLARAFLGQGLLNQALPLLDKIRHSVLYVRNGDSISRAEMAFDLAMLYRAIRNVAYSEELFDEALRLRRQQLGAAHVDTEITEFWARYECSKKERSNFDDKKLSNFVQKLEDVLNSEHSPSEFIGRHSLIAFCSWMAAHHMIARRLIDRGDLESVRVLLDSARYKVEHWFQNCSPLADYDEIRGDIYLEIGYLDESVSAYHLALDHIDEIGTIKNWRASTMEREGRQRWANIRKSSLYVGLAQIAILRGNLDQARAEFINSNSLMFGGRKILEIPDSEVAQIFRVNLALAEVYWLQKKYRDAVETWFNALDIFEGRLHRYAAHQTEAGLIAQLDGARELANSIYSAWYSEKSQAAQRSLVSVALAATLLIQDRETDELAGQFAPYNSSNSLQTSDLQKRLTAIRMKSATLEYSQASYYQNNEYLHEKQILQSEEASVMHQVRQLGSIAQLKNESTWSREVIRKIQNHLPQKSVLIQYVSFQPHNPKLPEFKQARSRRYMAIILHSSGIQEAIDLGTSLPIDAAIGELYHAVTDSKSVYNQEPARDLYNFIIRPFQTGLREAENIYIVPDSQLNWVPFGLLQGTPAYLGIPSKFFILAQAVICYGSRRRSQLLTS